MNRRMFPHTVTIYSHRVEEGKDVYTRTLVDGVYVYGASGVTNVERGEAADSTITIVSSPDRAADYGAAWQVKPNDRIVLARCEKQIASFRDLEGLPMMTAMKIEDNRAFGAADNITISGR